MFSKAIIQLMIANKKGTIVSIGSLLEKEVLRTGTYTVLQTRRGSIDKVDEELIY